MLCSAGLRDSCVEMCCQAAHTRAANTRGAARGRTRRTSTATASKSAYETCRVPLNWPLTALHGGSGTGSGTGGGGGHRKEEGAAHESTRFDAAALRAAYDAAGMPSWSLATAASPEANGTTTTAATPDTAFVTCMRQYCARSEPTQYNPEVSVLSCRWLSLLLHVVANGAKRLLISVSLLFVDSGQHMWGSSILRFAWITFL